jgi:hypothetical protein
MESSDIFIALPLVETRKGFTNSEYKKAKDAHKQWWNEHERPILGDMGQEAAKNACKTHWNNVVDGEYDFLKFFIDMVKERDDGTL